MSTSSSTSPLIAASGLGVTLGGRTILEDVDLTVDPGEIVTLIGPNGAGKTTLVRAILGLVPPTVGTVGRRAGLRLGYMPQKIAVDATLPLTVRRFLTLWHKGAAAGVDAAMERADVAHLAASPVQAVSGGEMQRVLLARALIGKPELLVLDEPDQALDLKGRAALFARIEGVRQDTGAAVLMVSHDLLTVMARTHTVVCVDRCIRCSGPPEDVREHPEFAAMFGAEDAGIALYHHHHDHSGAARKHVSHG
jgi:zinc transport system ATP-binding protein